MGRRKSELFGVPFGFVVLFSRTPNLINTVIKSPVTVSIWWAGGAENPSLFQVHNVFLALLCSRGRKRHCWQVSLAVAPWFSDSLLFRHTHALHALPLNAVVI